MEVAIATDSDNTKLRPLPLGRQPMAQWIRWELPYSLTSSFEPGSCTGEVT